MQDVIKHVSTHVDPYGTSPDPATVRLIDRIIGEVRPYSMVPDAGLACTIRRTIETLDERIPGDLVECGTWQGGASFAMLLAQRYAFGEILRPVWMYDSFQGMSPPSEQDGEHARWWRERSQSGRPDPDHQNYCVAPLAQVREAVAAFGFDKHVRIQAGWFHETLPRFRPQQIAVLRIDCDWYDPVKFVYEELTPLVSVGGRIILDDFYAWEGCVLATYEYLAKHRLPWPLRSAPNLDGAWMIKGKEIW